MKPTERSPESLSRDDRDLPRRGSSPEEDKGPPPPPMAPPRDPPRDPAHTHVPRYDTERQKVVTGHDTAQHNPCTEKHPCVTCHLQLKHPAPYRLCPHKHTCYTQQQRNHTCHTSRRTHATHTQSLPNLRWTAGAGTAGAAAGSAARCQSCADCP